jgi:hypothetical protein
VRCRPRRGHKLRRLPPHRELQRRRHEHCLRMIFS